jgi:GcrA cell cycle regulator
MNIVPDNRWTEDAKVLVSNLWTEGKSATEISALLAQTLGLKKSRNGVIGIIHRLGLSGPRAQRSAPVTPRQKASKSRTVIPSPPGPEAAPDQLMVVLAPGRKSHVPVVVCVGHPPSREAATVQAKRLIELAARDCRFPVGDATGIDQLHCARRSPEGDTYCVHHRQIAGGRRVAVAGPVKVPRYAR